MIRSWLSIAILFAIVIVGFLALYLRTSEGPVAVSMVDEPVRIGVVTYEHEFEDGTHSITGTAGVPTRCTTLTATAVVTDGTPASIRVDLAAPKDEEICLRLPIEREFSVDVEAPEDATITFYGNGELLTASTTP